MAFSYPFEETRIPNFKKLYKENFPNIPFDSYNELFPDIVSSNFVISTGCEKKDWDNLIQNCIIYCLEHNINQCFIFWNLNEDPISLNFSAYKWNDLYPKDSNWDPIQKYSIGTHAPIKNNLQYTLNFLPPTLPYQVFITDPVTFNIPKFHDPTCKDIIKNKGLKIFAHMPYVVNLARPNLGSFVKKYLDYASNLGIEGCVIHVGKCGEIPNAYQNMKKNILDAIQISSSTLLLETCASQKNEMLFDYNDFCTFVQSILSVSPNFGICIDSCHVFACGYPPNEYLKYCLSLNLPVKLIHYNDSLYSWKSRRDRHQIVGQGKIPWPMMEDLAKIAHQHNIPMVTEKN